MESLHDKRSDFEVIFSKLKAILQKHAANLSVAEDTPRRYRLDGRVGAATLQAWGGKLKRPLIPVAWVEIGTAYVSFHLMPAGDPMLRNSMSRELKARMQGQTCFNFKALEERLFTELGEVTARGVTGFRKARFITE